MAAPPPVPTDFAVSDLSSDQYDVYTLLFHLNHKSHHDGVRDYLVHRLYQVAEEDIEAILPQLCHLYMVWSPDRSVPLGDFLSHLCSQSIHFTLRMIWTFRAQQFHCPNADQRESMERLILSMEMSLINQSVFGPDGRLKTLDGTSRAQRHVRRKTLLQQRVLEDEALAQALAREGAGAGADSYHTPRSSHESSRDSSPARSARGGGSLAGSAPGSGFVPGTPTSTMSRSRSGTPKSKRGGGANLPPPPSFSLAASSASTVDAADSAAAAADVAAAPSAEPVASPGGLLFRPSPDTPAIVEPAAGQGAMLSFDHQTATQLSSHPLRELTLSGGGGGAAETTTAACAAQSVEATPSAGSSIDPFAGHPSSSDVAEADAAVSSVLLPTALSASPHSFACSPEHALLIDELYLVYSKHVRSEYFNSIQRLMEGFGRVSSALVKLPQGARSKKLRACMRDLDVSARGLYFPMHDRNSNRHYRILRMLPSESFVLNSRDKAPFLFHMEVQYTWSTVYDNDLHLAFKNREQIVAEAIELNQCKQCKWINQRKLTSIQIKQAKEARLAAHEAAHQPPGPNALAAAATVQAAQSQAAMHPDAQTTSAVAHSSEVTQEESDPNSLSLATHALALQVADSASPSSSSSSLAPMPSPASSRLMTSPLPCPTGEPRSTASSGRLVHTTSVPQGMDALLLQDTSAAASALAAHGRSVSTGSDLAASTAAPHSAAVHIKRPSTSQSSSSSAMVASSPAGSVPRPVVLHNALELLSQQAFGESFASRRRRIQSRSEYHRTLPHTDVMSLIFKHGDDVRQEVMAAQFIALFARIFADASLPLYLHPYCVVIASPNSGLIETIKDSMSVDSLKKNVSATPHGASLASFFHYYFGLQGPEAHAQALKNYVESLAAYSVVSYLLQIKDRHNGNLMLSAQGHLIHIDFGFLLSNSPGGNMNFEAAPFKLTAEFVEIMGGEDSEHYAYFQLLVIRGYLEARKHAHKFLLLLEILSQESKMACWAGGVDASLAALRDRFHLDWTEEQCVEHAHAIIEQSINNWRTVQYDRYQQITNGIS